MNRKVHIFEHAAYIERRYEYTFKQENPAASQITIELQV